MFLRDFTKVLLVVILCLAAAAVPVGLLLSNRNKPSVVIEKFTNTWPATTNPSVIYVTNLTVKQYERPAELENKSVFTNYWTVTNILAYAHVEVFCLSNHPALYWYEFGNAVMVVPANASEWQALTNLFPERLITNDLRFYK
jgi:hypothetical protein